jgi:uncharacterized membrane protein YphA (DoxX/SURF4 family)
MNTSTKVLLVLLRLAIGWHLLFAGLVKFRPDARGSEGYLSEAVGPLGPTFHALAGDRLADRLTPGPEGDPAKTTEKDRFPAALDREWEAHYARFVEFYGLPEPLQKEARGKLDQQKQKFAEWLLRGKIVVRTSKYGVTIEAQRPVADRVAEYQEKRDKLRKFQAGEYRYSMRTLFGPERTRGLLADKADVARIRDQLAGELTARTAQMHEALLDVLPSPRKADDSRRRAAALRAAVPFVALSVSAGAGAPLGAPAAAVVSRLADEAETTAQTDQKNADELWAGIEQRGKMPEAPRPAWKDMTRLDWVDFLVRWGLTLAGACLIAGLLTRFSAVVGALMILSFYLAAMPLPGVPEAFRAEGYPYVNKNIVEALALLLLATTQVGRWAGLDGVLASLFRRDRAADATPPAGDEAPAPSRPAEHVAEPVSSTRD